MSRTTARSTQHLAECGVLPGVTSEIERVAAQFAVAVTPAMLDLIDPVDPRDPIAAQFVPSAEELNIHPHELADPIGDEAFSPVKGIVHRYPDRLLLKLSHLCAVYCRFCFRREQVGPAGDTLSAQEIDAALDYIQSRPEIWEVILTGGDPFVLSDRRLAEVIHRLNAIDHVKIIRIHTRIPVVDPARISPELIAALRGRVPVYILIHCNHARELTPEARTACARLADAGIPLLSQSVLLRGVNDTPESLGELMRAFIQNRIKPHYLHHLDQARGTSHFRVPLAEAQALLASLRGHISGLCQPTYMLDIPGGYGKVPAGPAFSQENNGKWSVTDYQNRVHTYQDS